MNRVPVDHLENREVRSRFCVFAYLDEQLICCCETFKLNLVQVIYCSLKGTYECYNS